MQAIKIGGHGACITLEVLQYEDAEASNSSDANWLSSSITLDVGPFGGSYNVSLTTDDFVAFGNDLRDLLKGDKSNAVFSTDEEWLRLEITRSARGACQVIGESSFRGSVKATLSFSFETDLTYIGDVQRAISDVIKEFPPRIPGE